MLDDFRNDNNIKVVVVTGAGGKAFVSGADISQFEKERSNEDAVDALQRGRRQELPPRSTSFPKPTIAMIRGYCIGGGMGLATCCDIRIATEKLELRGAGGQARSRLRLSGAEAAGRRGRAVVRHGDLLHGAAIHRSRSADDGPREPGRCRWRIGKLREELRRHDRRQRAAHHQGGQGRGRRDDEGRGQARSRSGPTPRSTPASRAATTRKAARPSWKSASRCSPGAEGRFAPRRCSVRDGDSRGFAWRRSNCAG